MAITWTNDLNTGIEIIDQQHKRIVDYINQLETAMQRHDRDSVGQVMDELIDYTLSHFAFEESLQEEAGYSFAKPHKAVHDVFSKRVLAYQQRHNAGEDVAPQLHGMLCTWLLQHIKRDDMAYVSAVRSNMLALVDNKRSGGWLSNALGRFFK